MSEHTKGPWKAIPQGGSSTVVCPVLPGRNDRRSEVGYGYRDGEYCIGYPFLDDNDDVRMDFVCFSHADAKLIAAAPDMLKALREATLALDGLAKGEGVFKPIEQTIVLAQAAIAKAEGKS